MIGIIIFSISILILLIAGYLDNKKGMMKTKKQQIVWLILSILSAIGFFGGIILMGFKI